MARGRRPSPQTVAVLGALAAEPTAWRYGYELGLEVGLKAGSLYPILIRLADRGLQFTFARDAYTEAKAAFIADVLRAAGR